MKSEDILGTWCSVGHERIATDGTVTHPFGKDPLPARLVYSPDGSMAVMTIRPGLEKLRRGTPAEVRVAALDECIGYMGRFDVVGNIIRHHIEVSINPDLIGVTLERPVISAQGNRVTVRAPGDKNGAVDNITWEKTQALEAPSGNRLYRGKWAKIQRHDELMACPTVRLR